VTLGIGVATLGVVSRRPWDTSLGERKPGI